MKRVYLNQSVISTHNKKVRVDYQPKNANPIGVQWETPKMKNKHAYTWDNDLEQFVGLGPNDPINNSQKAIDAAKKLFKMFIGGK